MFWFIIGIVTGIYLDQTFTIPPLQNIIDAMKKPPAGVVLTMSAVCDMMGVKPEKIKDPEDPTKKIKDYWGPAKKHLLGDSKL